MYTDSYGNTQLGADKAGIFTKYGFTKFWLKRHNIGLDTDNIKLIELPRRFGLDRIAYFIRIGEKSFRPIKFDIDESKVEMNVGEEDVNWGITQRQLEAKRFDWQNFWTQYGAVIMWVVFSLFTMIVLIYFIRALPEILARFAEVLTLLQETLGRLEALNAGTAIID